MARARLLKPGFFTNEQLVALPPLTRLLFQGLWTIADREGRLEDRPRRIKLAVLPADDCDVDNMLDELADADLVVRYEVGRRRYIAIPTFLRHQHPHHREPESVIPAPPAADLLIALDEPEASPGPALDEPEASPAVTGNPFPVAVTGEVAPPCDAATGDIGYRDRFGTIEHAYGRPPSPSDLDLMAFLAAEYTQDEITAAIVAARRDKPAKLLYPSRIAGFLPERPSAHRARDDPFTDGYWFSTKAREEAST